MIKIGGLFDLRSLTMLAALFVASPAHSTELVDLLTGQLGVTQAQAEGGAGSLFRLAQQNLSATDFRTVANAIPGIDGLMGAAPALESAGGSALGGGSRTLSGVTSMLGGQTGGLAQQAGDMAGQASGSLGATTALADSFSQLGMGSDMIGQFIPIILDYTESQGGQQAMSLLRSAWLP